MGIARIVAHPDNEKVASQHQLSRAETVKLASAHLLNYVSAVRAMGGQIKQASKRWPQERVKAVARVYVKEHFAR